MSDTKKSFYHDIVMMIFSTRFEIDGVIKLVKSQELAMVFSNKIFFQSKVERTTYDHYKAVQCTLQKVVNKAAVDMMHSQVTVGIFNKACASHWLSI